MEGRVPVVVAANKAAIHKDEDIAENTIEFNRDAAPLVAGRYFKFAAVPAHAGQGIATSNRLETVRLLFAVVNKGQLDAPVMGKVQRAPLGVVKLGLCEIEVAGLGKITLAESKIEIARRIIAIAEEKLPAEIKQQVLTWRHRG